MAGNTAGSRGQDDPQVARAVRKRMLQIVFFILVQATVLFISSGRLDWLMAWVYIGVYVGLFVINALIILPKNPEMIAERAQIKEGAKDWDRLLAVILGFYGPVATLTVAGLDLRFGWSPQLASAFQFAAFALLGGGYYLVSWAMWSNRFFSGVVRIQRDRGHTVATGGPYQYVRHPGYAGMIASSLATPLLLGSLWALIPAGLTVYVTVVRTALEDRTLQEELDGYKDYTERVRYRLMPGFW